MIRCTGCGCGLSTGHEVKVDDMPYHTACVEKRYPTRCVIHRAPSERVWDENLRAVIEVSRRVELDGNGRIQP